MNINQQSICVAQWISIIILSPLPAPFVHVPVVKMKNKGKKIMWKKLPVQCSRWEELKTETAIMSKKKMNVEYWCEKKDWRKKVSQDPQDGHVAGTSFWDRYRINRTEQEGQEIM